jgi:hypothetical protein
VTGTVKNRRTLGGWLRLVFGTVAVCLALYAAGAGIVARDEIRRLWVELVRPRLPGRVRMLAYDL